MKVIIDSASKYVTPVVGAVSFAILTSIWTVFVRPQMVMASDLQQVADSVGEVNKKVSVLTVQLSALTISHMESQIDYLQDKIRELEATSHSRALQADEAYRLSEYKDRLEKARRLMADAKALE